MSVWRIASLLFTGTIAAVLSVGGAVAESQKPAEKPALRKLDISRKQWTGDLDTMIERHKWLWCARFFKSRGLAQEAVEGGHVQVNGEGGKASRQVRVADWVRITRDRERFELAVTGIPSRRGPAPEARQHYRETPESEAARAHAREFDRLSAPVSSGRPDKRERRDLIRVLKRRDGDA